jgi:hypothetical protein
VTGVALTTNGGIASSGTTSLTGAAYLDGTNALTHWSVDDRQHCRHDSGCHC